MIDEKIFAFTIWNKSYDKVESEIDKSAYETFDIPKKGGKRTIYCLDSHSKLFQLQKQLLKNFLNKQVLPIAAKGFVQGESYYTFLQRHVGSRYFMRLDIKNFFPSIHGRFIKDELSYVISAAEEEKRRILDLVVDIVTVDDILPQGTCTAPMISNICMAHLDQRITKYCQVFDVKYTRYADDLLFSSDNLDFSRKRWFLKKIKYILHTKSLTLNYSKLRFSEQEMVLNGYVIGNQEIRLSRAKLEDVRKITKYVNQNKNDITKNQENFMRGLNILKLKYRDLQKNPFTSVYAVNQYLSGYRAFLISMIDRNNQDSKFQKNLKKLLRKIEDGIIDLNKIYN